VQCRQWLTFCNGTAIPDGLCTGSTLAGHGTCLGHAAGVCLPMLALAVGRRDIGCTCNVWCCAHALHRMVQ
jgi:hypothetical protein